MDEFDLDFLVGDQTKKVENVANMCCGVVMSSDSGIAYCQICGNTPNIEHTNDYIATKTSANGTSAPARKEKKTKIEDIVAEIIEKMEKNPVNTADSQYIYQPHISILRTVAIVFYNMTIEKCSKGDQRNQILAALISLVAYNEGRYIDDDVIIQSMGLETKGLSSGKTAICRYYDYRIINSEEDVDPESIYRFEDPDTGEMSIDLNPCSDKPDIICRYLIMGSPHTAEKIPELQSEENIKFLQDLVKCLLRQGICNDSKYNTLCTGAYWYMITLKYNSRLGLLSKKIVDGDTGVQQTNMTKVFNGILQQQHLLEPRFRII